MKKAIFTGACAAFLSAMAMASPAEAQAQGQVGPDGPPITCGQPHTVAPGDTLQNIVRRVYGPRFSYRVLYRPNAAVIGPDPSTLRVGAVIDIPCREGATPAEAPAPETAAVTPSAPQPIPETEAPAQPPEIPPAPTPQPPETAVVEIPEAAPAPGRRRALAPLSPEELAKAAEAALLTPPIRIVSYSGRPPLHDVAAPDGGMLAEMVRRALLVEGLESRIDFIEDRAAQIDPLLTDERYDLALAWTRPECERPDALGAESTALCADLVWSDPLFESTVAFYGSTEMAPLPGPDAASDLTICMPRDRQSATLEAASLAPPALRAVSASSGRECLAMVAAGEADLAALDRSEGAELIGALGLVGDLREEIALARPETHRVVAVRTSARGAAAIETINRGLAAIRGDGRWFEIVQRTLSRAATQ